MITNTYDILQFSINKKLIDLSFCEKVYHYVNDISITPTCKECGKKVKFERGKYKEFCSCKCSTLNIDTKLKLKNTSIIKYGVPHPKKNNIVKEKYKNTCLEKYGVEHYSKTDEYKEKYINTCIERYNVENSFQSEKIMENTKYKKTKTFSDKFIEKYKEYIEILSIDNKDRCHIKCDCGKEHIFISNKCEIYNRLRSGLKICNICHPNYFISGGESEIYNFIKDNYDGEIIQSYRKIKNIKELDIFLPELNLAFEYNGTWWHNEINKKYDYHKNKSEFCDINGIKLIHIWEYDWKIKSKNDIIRSNILNLLKKYEKEIDYNNCDIKIISKEETNIFIEENSLYKYIESEMNIGLFYKDDLVKIISFNKYDDLYKLNNICNKININISHDNMIKDFISNENIITSSHRDYYDNIFEENIFELLSKTVPNKIMINDKYNIYDSGNLIFFHKKQ